MPKVAVPGEGVIEFPDSMSDGEISDAIQRNFPKLKEQVVPPSGGPEPAQPEPAPTWNGAIPPLRTQALEAPGRNIVASATSPQTLPYPAGADESAAVAEPILQQSAAEDALGQMRVPREQSWLEQFRQSTVGQSLMGPPPVELQAMGGKPGERVGLVQLAEKMLSMTSVPPPLADELRRLTDASIDSTKGTVLEPVGGVLKGAREVGLTVPLAPFPAGAGKAALPLFGAEYLASQPEAKRAFQEALARGDSMEAASLAAQEVLGGAILGAGGWHEFTKGWDAKLDDFKKKGIVSEETHDLVKEAIFKARRDGASPEFRALFSGIDPEVAGTTPEKVAAYAKTLGMEWKPVPKPTEPPPEGRAGAAAPPQSTPGEPNAPQQEPVQSSLPTEPQDGDSGGQTGQAGPGNSLPGPGGEPEPPNPAPAPPAGTPPVEPPLVVPPLGGPLEPPSPQGVILGKESTVRGANNSTFPVRYAWVPENLIQPSHQGESFSPNPLYKPLKNTRDYENDLAEREKVLAGAQNFDPESHIVNSRGAAEGPVIVAQGNDDIFRVMGGNGREQMIRRLSPEKRDSLRQVEDQEAGFLGLPPRPAANARIVRLLPHNDVATAGGIQAANGVVDLLNPSPGLVENTSKMAENDAAKVPPAALNLITPFSSPGLMRTWMQRLIADGVLDRNTRTQILNNDKQLSDYVERLLVQAAYQDNHIANIRSHPRVLETLKGLIDGASPLLIALRQAGVEGQGAANAFTEMIRRVADFQNQYPDRKLNQILSMVSDQAEMAEPKEVTLARGLAGALAGRVELLPQNKRGERKIDSDETLRNFNDLLHKMGGAVRAHNAHGGGDLLAPTDVFTIISNFLRADLGDAAGPALADQGDIGPSTVAASHPQAALLKRWRALMKIKEKVGALNQGQLVELEGLERGLGQDFMGFLQAHEANVKAHTSDAATIEARAKARLLAGPIETQGEMLDNPPQMTLFEGRSDYFPGFDAALNPVKNDDEPKINTRIEGPEARSYRGDRQLQLGGLQPAGRNPRSGSRAPQRDIITARPEFLNPESEQWKWEFRTFLANHQDFESFVLLKPHQLEGIRRAVWSLMRAKSFGLFDGTGAGKTAQELGVAAYLAKFYNDPVLIITERQGIIDDAFAKDAEMLGVPIYQYKGDPIEKHQKVFLATYYDVALGKIPKGLFNNIIFDEAHNLRGAGIATKAHIGLQLADSARRVMFATATPLDKPEQLWYLKSLLVERPELALLRVGINTQWKVNRNGGLQPVFTAIDGVTDHQIEDNLERIFDDIYRRGRGIKREVPLDNLTVNLKRIDVDAEKMRAVHEIMAQARAYYNQLGVPSRMVEGLVVMAGRGALESHKALVAIEETHRAIKEGKQVILFAYRVEQGMWGGGVTGLQAIADALEKVYGVGSVARLFGGGTTLAARRYQQQALESFNSGRIKIVVGSPGQAGTGINLDDIHGDAPRETIMITPPFSALELVQIAGRTNRLTTQSKAQMTLLTTNSKVDNWNLDITLTKLRRLGATAKGDIDKLTPQPLNERKRSYRLSPEQTEFNFQSALASLGTAQGKSAAGGDAGVHRRPEFGRAIQHAAQGIREGFLADGTISLVGKTIRSAAELAALAQATRNPAFELHHFVILKNQVVIQHLTTTIRSVDCTTAYPTGKDAAYINELTARMGGDQNMGWHNHPSGDPTPSKNPGDEVAVGEMFGRIPLSPRHQEAGVVAFVPLLTHYIVIDHGEYAEIAKDGTVSFHRLLVADEPDPILVASGPLKRLIKRKVETPGQLAEMGQEINNPDNVITLVFTDVHLAVRQITHVGLADFNDRQKFPQWLRETAARIGAGRVLGYYSGPADINAPAHYYYEAGLIRDMIFEGPGQFSAISGTESLLGAPALHSNQFWMGIERNDEVQTFLRDESAKDYAADNGDTFTTRALYHKPVPTGYAKTGSPEKGKTPVSLGGMQFVKPVAMPEIVKLAKALMGDLPQIKKLRGPRGVFHGKGAGLIQLDPSIFRNQIDAAKTLAHEIGHLVDYLPDKYMQRGNVLGRLLSLRDFLKNTFGGLNVTNKQLRAELLAVTRFWRPWDEATASEHFNAYRKSAVELYADAGSVLFNSPGLLEKMAPNFYREFWDALDRKPEVKAALFALQDFLDKGLITTLDTRGEDITNMFKAGEEIFQKKAEERELRRSSWKGFWLRLAQTMMDKNAPAISLQKKAVAAGANFTHTDPSRVLDELGLKNNANHALIRAVFEKVVKPLEDIGISQEDLGQVLFLDRIMAGDRAGVANPLGQTPDTARLQLAHLQRSLGFGAVGLSRMTLLRHAVQKFHDLIYPIIEEAVAVGAYNKKTFETIIKPNRDFYASFAVLDYLEDFLPAGLKNQVGTLKSVANPFTATLLKAVAINNLNALQRGKNVVIDNLLTPHFPGEIEPAKTTGFGPSLRVVPKTGAAILQRLENGQPAHYYVDPMIAEMFDKLTPMEINPILRVLDVSFRKIFYPMFITYNPAFMLFLSPMRDFKRTARNLPGAAPYVSMYRMAREYVRNWTEAKQRLKGNAGGLTREMEANFALAPPFDSFAQANRDDFLGTLMKRYKLTPDAEQKGFFNSTFMKPVRKVLDWVEFYGMILDSLPKYSAYRILTRQMKMAPDQAAGWVRNYAGLPNIQAKGTQVNLARGIYPFFNVCLQGWRADARLMTQPSTRGAWWIRWAMGDGFYAVLAGLATAGLLGSALKELFGGVSEYDKTNYQVVPLGSSPGGDFGRRVSYLRIPRDETSRLLSGIIYKLTSLMGDQPHGLPAELLDFGANQLPNINPVLSVTEKWIEYAEGINPTDPFKGKPIIPDTQFRAGQLDSLAPMCTWTLSQLGVMNFVKWDSSSKNTTELVTSMIPGVNRVFKTSDYGYREQQLAVEKSDAQERAQIQLKMPDNSQTLLHEYNGLKQIKPENRTDPQTERYATLQEWHAQYLKADQQIRQLEADKDKAEADRVRADVKDFSADYLHVRVPGVNDRFKFGAPPK